MKRTMMLALVFSLLGAEQAWSVEITSGPTLTMDPNGLTPLAGLIQLTTDVPTRVTLSVSDGNEAHLIRFQDFLSDHAVPLLGLAPDTVFTVKVIVTDADNNIQADASSLNVVTNPLPADFPLIEVLVNNPGLMEPGLTMLDRVSRGRGVPGVRYLIILDNTGQVVWYATFGASSMIKLPNGNLMYRAARTVIEQTMLGDIIQSIELADPGDRLHHDLVPTEHGTFLSITRKTVSVDGYPTSYTDPNAPTETADVLDEPVVEFGPDGGLINSWSLVDLLDPTRIGYSSLFVSAGARDWGHANAVIYDPRDDSIIVSVRHQDAVVKFSRSTGELIWILGPHDNWSSAFQPFLLDPVGTPFQWPYHQHAPMITLDGTLILHDNGDHKASPFDGRMEVPDDENYSRAVEYSIDEDAMEIEQVWDHGSRDTDWLHSGILGDADRLPITENVLSTFGGVVHTDGVAVSDLGLGMVHTRIIETNHATPAEKVFDVRLYDTDPASRTQVYRSDRIASLYSSTVTESPDSDFDYIGDDVDNCPKIANTNQNDANDDGQGNACDPDDGRPRSGGALSVSLVIPFALAMLGWMRRKKAL